MSTPKLFLTLSCLVPGVAAAADQHDLFLAPQDEGTGPVVVQQPSTHEPGGWFVGGLFELTDRPGVLRGAEDTLTGGEIDGLVTLNVVAGASPARGVRLSVAAPLFLASFGEAMPGAGVPGDLRVAGELSLVRAVELMPFVVLPTGAEDRGLGQEGGSAGLLASTRLQLGRVGLVGEGGTELPATEPLARPIRVGGAVVGRLTSASTLVVEGRAALGLTEAPRAEVLLSMRQRTRQGTHWLAGAGARLVGSAQATTLRLYAGLGFGVRGRRDLDGDGLVGEADRCPGEPEAFNGWQDDDGCPDRLADLLVVPLFEGQRLWTATAVATDGWETHAARPGPLVVSDRRPGEVWAVRVRLGCLQGEAETVLAPGENALPVQLEPRLDARLDLLVRDSFDRAVEAATIEVIESPTGCGPAAPPALVQGRAPIVLGAGRYRFRVTAPGHAPHLVDVRLRPGEWASHHVVLDGES